MTTPVININDYPKHVPILAGAAQELVSHRQLCGLYVGKNEHKKRKRKSDEYYKKRTEGYHVNRDIKTWSIFFLLKALTTSGKIKNWTGSIQKKKILAWCQCNEGTFRRQLDKMDELQLCGIEKEDNGSINIILTSYEKAAAILGIAFEGTYTVNYNPDINHGKQVFRFILTAEEFRQEQIRQLEALMYHLEKNPSLKNDLHFMLKKFGADDKQLYNPVYFQQRLLALQMQLFKEGSDILKYVFSRRADINRSGNLIKDHHTYKSAQSVSYLKKRMQESKVIGVQKIIVESAVRSRLYIPDAADPSRTRDGYKYLKKKKHTAWVLTDQVSFNYDVQHPQRKETTRRAA